MDRPRRVTVKSKYLMAPPPIKKSANKAQAKKNVKKNTNIDNNNGKNINWRPSLNASKASNISKADTLEDVDNDLNVVIDEDSISIANSGNGSVNGADGSVYDGHKKSSSSSGSGSSIDDKKSSSSGSSIDDKKSSSSGSSGSSSGSSIDDKKSSSSGSSCGGGKQACFGSSDNGSSNTAIMPTYESLASDRDLEVLNENKEDHEDDDESEETDEDEYSASYKSFKVYTFYKEVFEKDQYDELIREKFARTRTTHNNDYYCNICDGARDHTMHHIYMKCICERPTCKFG
jgi:hypothetical protein